MNTKGIVLSMGLGAMVGAVAVMMMPQNNPTRKLAEKAACKVEDAASKVTDKFCSCKADM